MNRMDFYVMGDPREKALRDAVEECVANRSLTRGWGGPESK
jgi:hypothetical protein